MLYCCAGSVTFVTVKASEKAKTLHLTYVL